MVGLAPAGCRSWCGEFGTGAAHSIPWLDPSVEAEPSRGKLCDLRGRAAQPAGGRSAVGKCDRGLRECGRFVNVAHSQLESARGSTAGWGIFWTGNHGRGSLRRGGEGSVSHPNFDQHSKKVRR